MERPHESTIDDGVPLSMHAVPTEATGAFSALCRAFALGLPEGAIDTDTVSAVVDALLRASSWPPRSGGSRVVGEWTAAVLDAPDAGVRVTRTSNGAGDTLSLARLADGTPSVVSWMRVGTPPQFGSVHLVQQGGAAEWVVRDLTKTIRRPAPTSPSGLSWAAAAVGAERAACPGDSAATVRVGRQPHRPDPDVSAVPVSGGGYRREILPGVRSSAGARLGGVACGDTVVPRMRSIAQKWSSFLLVLRRIHLNERACCRPRLRSGYPSRGRGNCDGAPQSRRTEGTSGTGRYNGRRVRPAFIEVRAARAPGRAAGGGRPVAGNGHSAVGG